MKNRPNNSGFTFVELLITAVLAAMLITAAVVGFSTIAGTNLKGGRVDVSLPDGILTNFYGPGFGGSYVTMAMPPDYVQSVAARNMKDRFLRDVSSASAVFCLGRNEQMPATLRTNRLRFASTTNSPVDFRTNATPESFREFLVQRTVFSNSGSLFPSGQSGVMGTTNATIFLIGGLDSTLQFGTSADLALNVLATYEVDFVAATQPAGVYASVRRYAGTNAVPSDYYHAFYPADAALSGENSNTGTNGFRPLGVFFGRTNTPGVSFALAPNQPFSFLWWPDPLMSSLGNRSGVANSSGGAVRDNYAAMAGRTSLFFVVPTFPGL